MNHKTPNNPNSIVTETKIKNETARINKYIEKYPDILSKTPRGKLICLICNKTITTKKELNIIAHLSNFSHKKNEGEFKTNLRLNIS